MMLRFKMMGLLLSIFVQGCLSSAGETIVIDEDDARIDMGKQGDMRNQGDMIVDQTMVVDQNVSIDMDIIENIGDRRCEAHFKLKLGSDTELVLDDCLSTVIDVNVEYDIDHPPVINGGSVQFNFSRNQLFLCAITFDFTALSCGVDQVYQVAATFDISGCPNLPDQYKNRYLLEKTQGVIVDFIDIDTGSDNGNFDGMPLFVKLSGYVGTRPLDGINLMDPQNNTVSAYLYGDFLVSSHEVRTTSMNKEMCDLDSEDYLYDVDMDGVSGSIYGGVDCSDVNAVNQGKACFCGDMIVSAGEACDDGNMDDLDLCKNNCQMNDHCGDGCLGMEMILIQAGMFNMGSGMMANEQPIRPVQIRTNFHVGKTEVTVGQYRACVNAGVCTAPDETENSIYCNWTSSAGSKENHPVNCVDWEQARTFARWIGGDLLSEAQWEYVATSQGQAITYPWGNDMPTCQFANYSGCVGGTAPVCSTTGGNTTQRVCDLGGNVWEWVLDEWHDSYSNAPSDDTAWCSDIGVCNTNTSAYRVARGGSWYIDTLFLRSAFRGINSPRNRYGDVGFRVAKSVH